MIQILGALFILALTLLPQYWVKQVFAKNRQDTPNILGNGKDFALHLLEKLKIKNITVVEQKGGNYYDPVKKVLALSPENYNEKSLCAVVIAAHEVGHIIQDYSNSFLLKLRFFLVKLFQTIRLVSNSLLIISPFLFVFRPVSGLLALLLYFGASLIGVLIHLCTLPLELDASFSKALPILEKGGYLNKKQLPKAKQILQAAAFTYLAAALNNIIFSIFQWRGWTRR